MLVTVARRKLVGRDGSRLLWLPPKSRRKSTVGHRKAVDCYDCGLRVTFDPVSGRRLGRGGSSRPYSNERVAIRCEWCLCVYCRRCARLHFQ